MVHSKDSQEQQSSPLPPLDGAALSASETDRGKMSPSELMIQSDSHGDEAEDLVAPMLPPLSANRRRPASNAASVAVSSSSPHTPQAQTQTRTQTPPVQFDPPRSPSEAVQLLFKGRKYNLQAKVNLHVHVLRHDYADTLEVIAFNTSTFVEAEHVYLPASLIYERVEDAANLDKAEMIAAEYHKLNLVPPTTGFILQCLLNHQAAMFVVDRLTVSLKPSFSVDCKDLSDKALRKAIAAGSSSSATTTMADEKSLTIRKPERVKPCSVRRFGKSSTLVGDVQDVFMNKDEEILGKLVANLSSSAMGTQGQQARLSLLLSNNNGNTPSNKRNNSSSVSNPLNVRKRNNAIVGLKSFQKFRNDNDLLQESLSFLHVSDFLLCQRVCRRWHSVLSYALRGMSSLWITSRDYYLNEKFVRRKLHSRHAMVSRQQRSRLASFNDVTEIDEREEEGEDEDFGKGDSSRFFRPRAIFVSSDTVIRTIRAAARNISELHLHYIVLNTELLTVLQSLSGKLKRLTLGIIKMDDSKSHTLPSDPIPMPTLSENSPVTLDGVPTTPRSGSRPSSSSSPMRPTPTRPAGPPPSSATAPPPKNSRRSVTRRSFSAAVDNVQASPTTIPSTSRLAMRAYIAQLAANKVEVASLRYMQSGDVDRLLMICGLELTHLSLSLTVGDLPENIFQRTPKLQSLTILNSHLAPRIESTPSDLESNVPLKDFVQSFAGIGACDLLVYMSDSTREAFLLTDKRGRIVVANDPWEQMFGYKRQDIAGDSIEFLSGDMTNATQFDIVVEGLKTQVRSVETTVFLHRADRRAFLVQVLLIPNVVKFRGTPFAADCLSQEFLGQLALEQEEIAARGADALSVSSKNFKVQSRNKMDWRIINSEYSYHLLRFGLICEPFVPFPHHLNNNNSAEKLFED